MSKRYPSELSGAEEMCLMPKGGRPATYFLRTILNATLYLLRTGCLWRY